MRLKQFSTVAAALLAQDAIADVSPASVASALVAVEKEAYKAEYQAITYHDIIPVINLNSRTATTFQYPYLTEAGRAELSKGDGSIAWIDSFVGVKSAPLFDGNVGYKFQAKELERAAAVGAPLDSFKAEVAVEASLRLAQEIAFNGDDSRGIVGFFNNPDIPSVTPIGGTAWSTKTADEVLADINHLFATAHSTTKEVEFKPGDNTIRLMLPTEQWGYIATTRVSATSDKTILDFIASSSPWITDKKQIISSPEIASTKIRIYHFDKKKLAFYWGHMVQFLAPQNIDLSINVPGEFSIGGTAIRKPLSVWDMDGIA